MRKPHDDEKMAILAVLTAAAREAEELIADAENEIPPESAEEADRRLKLFMLAARQMAQ
jgi:hypothetical protein